MPLQSKKKKKKEPNFFLYESQEPSENQVELIESKLQNEDSWPIEKVCKHK